MRYVVVSVVKGKAGNFNNNLRKEIYEKFNAKSSKLPAHFTIKSPFEADNIRELENVVEFMVSLSDERGIADSTMLPESFVENYTEFLGDDINKSINIKEIIPLKDIEKLYIKKALEKYGNTTEGKKIAAKKLGIGIATLYRKIDGLE